MDQLRDFLNTKVSFLTSTSLVLATVVVFCIIKNSIIYLLLFLVALLIASLVLILYWLINRKALSKSEKWGILFSLMAWLSLFFYVIYYAE